MTNAGGASVSILNYGGIVTRIIVPDSSGVLGDVALGYDSIGGYIENPGYLGALIGRVGNRINRGKCTVGGRELSLAANANGHHLHGGNIGFDKKNWDADIERAAGEDRLILRYESPDGEENYPGTLSVTVTYAWTDKSELKIHYEATTDLETLCNLTNHSYFNLNGEGKGTIEDHIMRIYADHFTVVDADCIPTGELRSVVGTPFDMRSGARLGDGMALTQQNEQLRCGGGYDHNFALTGSGMRTAAVVKSPGTGRVMKVLTDKPGVQLYVGNMLATNLPGKCGRAYAIHEGLCLETQFFPDSVNHPDFPSSALKPGEKYDYTTVYAFSAGECCCV
jgi:aldose 1-epimerase